MIRRPLSETDPDTNYFNQIEDCNRMSCNYLLEDDFIKRYKSDQLENSFSLFHVNIRSLNSKLLSLTACLNTLQKEFQIIGLSETWLNEQNKADAKIRYYNAIHSCRDTLSRGGGVSLYIHESMDFKERSDLSVVNENTESCFVEIPKGTAAMNSDVIVGVIYRPPGESVDMFNEQLNSMLQRISGENKTLYIMGDFNINHHPTNNFLETLYFYSLTPLITKPTRITENTATLIDNIFTNNSVSSRRHLSGILYTDISDHLPVFFFDTCSEYTRKEEFHGKRMINTNSLNRLMAELNAINWSFVYENETDAQLGYTDFINIFKKVYDKCIPIRYVKRKVNPSKPWLTEGLMKCIKVKNKLYKERVKSPSPLRIEIYKRYRNKLNSILRATEKGYFETLFQKNKNNLRKSWQIIKDIIGKHKHGPIMSKRFKVNSTEIDVPL